MNKWEGNPAIKHAREKNEQQQQPTPKKGNATAAESIDSLLQRIDLVTKTGAKHDRCNNC